MSWGLSSLLHVMHMCREANLASSSSWMYIAFNPYWSICFTPSLVPYFGQKGGEKFVLFLLQPLCWWLTKRGRRIWGLYACFPCFIIKGGEEFMFMHICFVLQIGEKDLICFISIHLHTCLWAFIAYLYCLFLCMS